MYDFWLPNIPDNVGRKSVMFVRGEMLAMWKTFAISFEGREEEKEDEKHREDENVKSRIIQNPLISFFILIYASFHPVNGRDGKRRFVRFYGKRRIHTIVFRLRAIYIIGDEIRPKRHNYDGRN